VEAVISMPCAARTLSFLTACEVTLAAMTASLQAQTEIVNQQVARHDERRWQPEDDCTHQRPCGRLSLGLDIPHSGIDQVENGDLDAVQPVIDHAEDEENLANHERRGTVEGDRMII